MIRIFDYATADKAEIFAKVENTVNVEKVVSDIVADVRARGDEALLEYTERFDRCALDSLEVSAEEFDEAMSVVEPEFIEILKRAAANIRSFHEQQVRRDFVITENSGVVLGQRITPIEKVGFYVPGGTAPLSSSTLMGCIPAKIAGCSELVMCTPPSPDGKIDPSVLAAAKIAGVDRVFKIGGAQAVAAMAYGTASVPKVDKIVGPGNAYVAEAKRQVYGVVSIDMIAGPSDILVIADSACDARIVAADMLSQAEHDKLASAVLVTDSAELAAAVSAELELQIPELPRAEIARTSIENNGRIIITGSIEQAIEVSNIIAPEHLEICVDEPFNYLPMVVNAGSVFLGKNCPESLGDYFAGPNHTLPTNGTARFSSPLSVDDFIKKTQFTYYSREALRLVADDVAAFAEKEMLSAHARCVTKRFDS